MKKKSRDPAPKRPGGVRSTSRSVASGGRIDVFADVKIWPEHDDEDADAEDARFSGTASASSTDGANGKSVFVRKGRDGRRRDD